MHRSKKRLFDQLVGAPDQCVRNGKAEGFSGFEINHKLDFHGLLHG
jgi:hypothetical protein